MSGLESLLFLALMMSILLLPPLSIGCYIWWTERSEGGPDR